MDRALIDQAVGALSVQAVLLRSASVRADDALLPPADIDLSVVAKYRAGPTGEFETVELSDDAGSTANIVIFHFRAGVRLVDQSPLGNKTAKKKSRKEAEPVEAKVRLEIEAEFSAHYRLRTGVDVMALKPALEEFGTCNVGLHVWPYWREYVQSTCARLGIPAIPIGMYRLPKAPIKKAQADDKDA